jgi:hypothetical protein
MENCFYNQIRAVQNDYNAFWLMQYFSKLPELY